MILLIYFSGVILSFIVGRYTNRTLAKRNGWKYTLNFVFINIVFSIMSWIGLFIWVMFFIINQDDYEIKISKWL